jgi:23S rRNA pseudouridine1911/1915/1917 synthase
MWAVSGDRLSGFRATDDADSGPVRLRSGHGSGNSRIQARNSPCSRVCASPAVPVAWESFCRMYTNEMKDAVDMLSRILYEDKDIIVAYKPAGLAVQTARLGQQDMVSELKNRREKGGNSAAAGRGEPYLGLIHRLDQPVEGILAFARTRAAAASLTGQLRAQGDEGGFCKHYYAVLCGVPDCREGRLEDYLYKQALKNGKHTDYRAVIVNPDTASAESALGEAAKARRAVLEYRILEPNKEQGLALADIRIRTGRFHQIRAQMAHAGLPLLGDLKYGSPEARALAAACGVRNVALCAYSLGFVHPVSGEKMDFRIKPENPAFSSFHLTEKSAARPTWNQ